MQPDDEPIKNGSGTAADAAPGSLGDPLSLDGSAPEAAGEAAEDTLAGPGHAGAAYESVTVDAPVAEAGEAGEAPAAPESPDAPDAMTAKTRPMTGPRRSPSRCRSWRSSR
jgi:hypothetical protein